MRVTSTTEYALRALFDMAYHARGVSAQIKKISERQDISPRYLEQVFQKLRKAGLVGSERGPRGGFRLLKEPKEITFCDVLEAVEGPLEFVFGGAERDGGDRDVCETGRACPTDALWREVGEQISAVLQGSTIQDLCRQAEAMGVERRLDSRLMFYI